MRRSGVVAMVAAAVLGCTAGAYAAVVLPARLAGPRIVAGPNAAGGPMSGSPVRATGQHSDSAPPPTAAAGAPVFYVADGRLHDGARTVPVQLAKPQTSWPVASVQRLRGCWLLVQVHRGRGDQDEYLGTVIYPDGGSWSLGRFGPGWDVDPSGRVLFAAGPGDWLRATPATRTVTRLALGPADRHHGRDHRPPAGAADGAPESWLQWTEDGLLTGWTDDDGTRLVLSAGNPARMTAFAPRGVADPATAPAGDLVVGSTGGDSNTPDRASLTGGAVGAPAGDWWRRCDYRRLDAADPYSPDGSLLLTVPADTGSDQAGLGEVALLDARTGAPRYLIDLPGHAVAVTWADDESLTVLTRPRTDPRSTVVHRVDLAGNAERVATVRGPVTAGSA